MGIARPPIDVKLIIAITFKDNLLLLDVKKRLQLLFGPIDLESEIYDFLYTQYYAAEMGEGLKKQFITFKNLIKPNAIVAIKLLTNHLEKQFLAAGKRRINIDPGYISSAKLVLATTKNYDHRIYLNKGIYGDVQLRMRDKHYRPNDWTYPDYRAPHSIAFFEKVKKHYLKQLKKKNGSNHV